MYSKCQKCGKKLVDPQSMKRGYGPECWAEVIGYNIQYEHQREDRPIPGQMNIFMYPEFAPNKGDDRDGG